MKTPKTDCSLKLYEGEESISLDSRFADLENPGLEYYPLNAIMLIGVHDATV